MVQNHATEFVHPRTLIDVICSDEVCLSFGDRIYCTPSRSCSFLCTKAQGGGARSLFGDDTKILFNTRSQSAEVLVQGEICARIECLPEPLDSRDDNPLEPRLRVSPFSRGLGNSVATRTLRQANPCSSSLCPALFRRGGAVRLLSSLSK